MMRHIPLLVFSLLGLMLFLALAGKPQRDDAKSRGEEMAVHFPEMALKDDKNIDAPLGKNDLVGKVSVINFFATWCAPCEAEMPELLALKKAHPTVQFYGVVWNDAPTNVKSWLKEHGAPFDDVRFDPRGRGAIALGMRGIPETFVVDAEGMVRFHVPGAISETMRREKIDPLLSELEAAHAR